MTRFLWKLIAGGIVLFWLAMSGQLAWLILFPDRAGMTEVPPEFVAGLILGCAEPSQLIVLKNGRRAGEVSLGTRVPEAGRDGAGALTQLSIAGWLAVDHPLTEIKRISGRLLLNLDEKFSLKDLGLTLRIPGSSRGFELEFEPATRAMRYRPAGGGAAAGPFQEGDIEQLKLLFAMWGVDLGAFGLGDETPSPAPPVELEKVKESGIMTARRGQMTVRGERFHGYLLVIDLGEESTLELTVSEAGELMRVETFLDYELLAEVFVPADARAAGGKEE